MDLYQEITNTIISSIEAGAGEFQMPWHRGAAQGRPVNALTGKGYNGVNVLALWIAAQAHGYTSSEWATYRQWGEKGAQVRKGEKSSLVMFYKSIDREDDADGDDGAAEGKQQRRGLIAKAYRVFNAAQVDGYTPQATAPKIERPAFIDLAHVDQFMTATGADIRHGGDRAFFSPALDYVALPNKADFYGSRTSSPAESYYSTALHELTHWTGHKSRLDRLDTTLKGRFGSESYAVEELVAELGAAFLCADLGVAVDPRLDHAQYCASWLKVLKDDKKAIFTAASKATAAAAYLHDLANNDPMPAPVNGNDNDALADLATSGVHRELARRGFFT